jgi:hypothetical protein
MRVANNGTAEPVSGVSQPIGLDTATAGKTSKMNEMKAAAEFIGPIDSTGRGFPAAGLSPAFWHH